MMSRQTTDNKRQTNWVFVLLLVVSCWLLVGASLASAQSVDILWQGETYVAPFYQGRALWSKQAGITFVAIPQGLGNPANLYYKWSRNGTVLGNINGVGKNTLSFTDSILSKSQNFKVEIIADDKTVLAGASLVVTPLSPTLVVYENNPLYGFMFHREVSGTYVLRKEEVTFAAFPFFFSIYNRLDSALDYEWRTNVGGAETSNSVTYRVPEGATGSSPVSVQISNKEEIAQRANRNFLIEFGK